MWPCPVARAYKLSPEYLVIHSIQKHSIVQCFQICSISNTWHLRCCSRSLCCSQHTIAAWCGSNWVEIHEPIDGIFRNPKLKLLYHIRPYFVGKFPYIGHWYEGCWTINAADWNSSYSIPHHSTACSCWNNESQSEIMDARGLAQRWVYDSELPIYGYQYCSNKWYKWSPRALDALDPIIFNHPLTNITMERSTMFHGKIHYFDWAIFNSYFDITNGD